MTSVCKAKNPETCRYHMSLSQVDEQINALTQQMAVKLTPELLEKFHELRTKKDELTQAIEISESDSFAAVADGINPVLGKEVKALLKRLGKRVNGDYEWNDFVKAAVHYTAAQSYGTTVESLYLKKTGLEKVKASDERGDAYDRKRDVNIEIKFTVMSYPDYRMNIVQIRPHHNIQEYHIITYNKETEATELYVLSKDEMAEELVLTGEGLAHGTTKTKDAYSHPEHAIRFSMGSDIHTRWQKYKKPVTWS